MKKKPSISIITPVNNRIKTWEMCEKFCGRAIENYNGEVQWIVSDGGTDRAKCKLGQTHLLNEPLSCPNPTADFIRNLTEGLKVAKHDIIFFYEDDDWHSPDYFTQTVELFKHGADIVGEGCARYYYIPTFKYRLHGNMKHASLCQTALRGKMRERLRTLLEEADTPFLDLELWKHAQRKDLAYVASESINCVGLKGLTPGNFIGNGHREHSWYKPDLNNQVLEKWLGKEDAEWVLNNYIKNT